MTNKAWPHAPIHRLSSDGVYMVTGATLHKRLFFSTPEKLTSLENDVLTLAKHYRWHLEAWAVFMNHYHLIARSELDAARLDSYLKHLHSKSAIDVNVEDSTSGRQGFASKVVSFTPGFSPVLRSDGSAENRFNGFRCFSSGNR